MEEAEQVGMKILEHPLAEQTGEETAPDGSLFSAVFTLRGTYTFKILRNLLEEELIPAVQADMNDARYRMATIVPGEIALTDKDNEAMETDSFLDQYSRGKGLFYLDSRAAEYYLPTCPHMHPRRICTSILSVTDGDRPTLFFTDEEQLLASVDQNKDSVEGIFDKDWTERCSQNPRVAAAHVTNLITDQYSKMHPLSTRQRLERFVQTLKALSPKVARLPKAGTVNIFASDVIHAADDFDASAERSPGVLFTQAWK